MSEVKRVRKRISRHVPVVKIGEGMDNLADLRRELDEYVAVLLGRKDPPIDRGVMTLMELAEAYFARATEMEMVIHRGEIDGVVPTKSKLYYFRTRELRAFQELAKAAMELGSRRVTAEKLVWEQERGSF